MACIWIILGSKKRVAETYHWCTVLYTIHKHTTHLGLYLFTRTRVLIRFKTCIPWCVCMRECVCVNVITMPKRQNVLRLRAIKRKEKTRERPADDLYGSKAVKLSENVHEIAPNN